MIKNDNLSTLIAKYFSSSAGFHLTQVDDGSYRKTIGRATPAVIQNMLANKRAIACYQKNLDQTINWICFDFDIIKSNINTPRYSAAEKHLLSGVRIFTEYLTSHEIIYLMEFSGNRGIHIWIHVDQPLLPHAAFSLVKHLLEQSSIPIDRSLIAIDLFPSSASNKSIYGKGVKTPLSMHAKSGCYSLIIEQLPDCLNGLSRSSLDDELINRHVKILENYLPNKIEDIERKLDFKFSSEISTAPHYHVIRKINVTVKDLTVDDLLKHWHRFAFLAPLAREIESGLMQREHREIVVGIVKFFHGCDGNNFGRSLLSQIFSRQKNYDARRTENGLKKLQFFQFPSQEMIEARCGIEAEERYSIDELGAIVAPHFQSIDEGLFLPHEIDLKVTKIAESSYIHQNDEVRCIKVIEEIDCIDFEYLVSCFEQYIYGRKEPLIYRHHRKEKNKEVERQLITLDAEARLFSTWAVKCLSNFYNHSYSSNTFGYKLNPNFKGGYIFRPWLYQWIEFLSHIKDVIEHPDYLSYTIVKVDVKSFYDSIPQDRLERFLLTGLNERVSKAIEALNEHSKDRYSAVIGALMQITRLCNRDANGRVGLPQGPAYARYFAELYMSPIDDLMDRYIEENELVFYHRYVDDIFFLASSRAEAEIKLSSLTELLKLLGLSLNSEKTVISYVADFSSEFDKYRAQAKYAVDAISKNFEDATDHQKDLALSEYNKLISIQDDNDDAVFLFSHLTGVEYADRYRDEVTVSIIENGVGRGNLFKHVFTHLLDSPRLWRQMDTVDELNALQSEVFTSVAISNLISHSEPDGKVIAFIEHILPKLTITSLVNEHLIYLRLYFKIGPELKTFKATDILSCIKSAGEPDRLNIGSDVLNACASVLNGVEDTAELLSYLYPMCIKANIGADTLKGFSQIFYAKLAKDSNVDKLRLLPENETLLAPRNAAYFYHLLCLFSLAESNDSDELLTDTWKFCVDIYNLFEKAPSAIKENAWYKNLDLINVSKKNLNIILASISDGAIWRGSVDRYGIYTHFHNALIVFLLAEHKNENNEDFAEAIASLKEKGIFYKWIFDENAVLFPSRDWFIFNARYNDCVLLKRHGEILIRKQTGNFISKTAVPDNAADSLTGYSDDIALYNPDALRSVNIYIRDCASFFNRLQRICAVFEFYCKEGSSLPNFFTSSSLMHGENFSAFSDELLRPEYFIFDHGSRVEPIKANVVNFVKSLFLIAYEDTSAAYVNDRLEMTTWRFYESCISYFENEKELCSFMRAIMLLFKGEAEDCSETNFDLAIASCIHRVYVEIDNLSYLERIKHFYGKYNKIHKDSVSKHIYKCSSSYKPADNNLEEFFDTIIVPLKLANKYRPDLGAGLVQDLETLKERLSDLVSDIPDEATLIQFLRCNCSLSLITEKIKIDGRGYTYDNVIIVNPALSLLESYTTQHEYLLQASEDAFAYYCKDKVYLYLAQQELTIAYSDVNERYNRFFRKNDFLNLYPDISEPVYSFDLNPAVQVVACQRDISFSEANKCLRSWLLHVPKSIRQFMVELIAAHEYISKAEVNAFRNHFEGLKREGRNPFLLKRICDFNGTHRMLCENPEVGRDLDNFGPNFISYGETQATLVADICISGSQISKALEYYVTSIPQEDHGSYFSKTEEERKGIGERLKGLATLNLSFVLYTQAGIRKIKASLLCLGLKCSVNVVNGKDISESAFLGSTDRLSVKSKAMLVNFLKNKELTDDLAKSVFEIDNATRKHLRKKLQDCEAQLNLVARHKSMPKKGLDFLFRNFRHRPDSSIFVRVRESIELN